MIKACSKFLAFCSRFTQLLIALLLVSSSAVADTLTIATASNFRPVLEQLSQAFSEQEAFDHAGHQINISSASSGVLYAQILQGAPFQLFFSANQSYPEKLVASGHGAADTLATYVIGKLFLVSRHSGKGSGKGNEGDSPKEILSKAKRIAIANPRTAPYGIAAMEAMESLGIDQRQTKLVVGNNIAQAWQFFHSGNADVAIVSASLIYSAEVDSALGLKGEQQGLFSIDLSSYLKHPVRQSRVAIKPVSPLAEQFLGFINTQKAQKIIADGGYSLPGAFDSNSSMKGIINSPIRQP